MNIKVRITLFGKLGEAIGRELDLPLTAAATAGDARRMLVRLYPGAAAMLAPAQARACLEDRMVDDDAVIGAAADLAFLPPLSGG